MVFYYDFESPIEEIEKEISAIDTRIASGEALEEQKSQLTEKLADLRGSIYANLEPWQRVQMARHPSRPTTMVLLPHIVDDFMELHGDRTFRDDPAIVGGVARIGEQTVFVVAHAKGKGTSENLKRNFGMAHPEGYRKALRLFKTAARLGHPIVTIIDTPGTYPGLAAEERGQAEAIADNLVEMAGIRTPIVAVVLSEGGSGGALGLGVADRVYMLENSIYSVISPEGCAAILWKDASKAKEAAAALKLTAEELLKIGIVDGIIPEPVGGAHQDVPACAQNIRRTIEEAFDDITRIDLNELVVKRRERFRAFGRS